MSQYGGPSETPQERKEKVSHLTLSVRDLFDLSKPWILVPEGSLLGYFDWVPLKFRNGPWSPVAPVYLSFVIYVLALVGIHCPSNHVEQDPPLALFSAWWWYNALCFAWMMWISSLVWKGPAGPAAWGTFSMWTWTMVMFRHGHAAVQPFLGGSLASTSAKLLQLSRFPSLLMGTLVVFLWNGLVGPSIYLVFMDTPQKKRNFIKYFANFRLTQLHVFVLPCAVLNAISTSSYREFWLRDWYAAVLVSFTYMLFYLLILDRIGVHVYPIFSPRVHWCFVTWSFLFYIHGAVFWMYNAIFRKLQ